MRAAPRNTVEQRFPTLLPGLEPIPIGQHFIRGLGLGSTEHVGMTRHQFATDRFRYFLDPEQTGLGGERCVEHHLEEQVAQLLLEFEVGGDVGFTQWRVGREGVDCGDSLVGLLEEVDAPGCGGSARGPTGTPSAAGRWCAPVPAIPERRHLRGE